MTDGIEIPKARRVRSEKSLPPPDMAAAVVEQARESIAVTDPQGRISYANSAFEAQAGRSLESVRGKRYPEAFESDWAEDGTRERLEAVFAGAADWTGRLRRKKADGRLADLDVIIAPIFDRDRSILHFSVTEHDVTAQVQTERHLCQTRKLEALSMLAGGVAHDFNNILMTIAINAELAQFCAAEGSSQKRYLELAVQAAQRGKDLVKEIIPLGRRSVKERRSTAVGPVVEKAIRSLRSSLPSSIEIRQSLDASNDVVLADPAAITRVLTNLADNSADAMRDAGGVFHIGLSNVDVDADMVARWPDLKVGPYVRLTVTDTGAGMDEAVLSRIFDPFFTTKKKGEGGGMGLAVVLGIVKNYGGVITVDSQPGKGATFTLFFPLAAATALPARSPELAKRGTEKILLVDDEETLALGVQDMLEQIGYKVTVITSPTEALSVLEAEPRAFDLVITDQSMPRMSGVDLAEKVLKVCPGLPVILCTGFSEGIDGEEARARGVTAYLTKPYSAQEIGSTIRRVLDGNRL